MIGLGKGLKQVQNDFLCRDWPRQWIKTGLTIFLCRDWPRQWIEPGLTRFLCRGWPMQGITTVYTIFLCRDWPRQRIKSGFTTFLWIYGGQNDFLCPVTMACCAFLCRRLAVDNACLNTEHQTVHLTSFRRRHNHNSLHRVLVVHHL